MNEVIPAADLGKAVTAALEAQPITDIHTHLYPPPFGTPVANATGAADPRGLMLWGIDELLTYHYLVAEVYRVVPATKLPYEQFWAMDKRQQAQHIWKHLFLEHSPLSEACRGVLTVLQKLGLDPGERDLDRWRRHFQQQDPSRHIDRCMELANVASLVMTNAVFDDNERARWLADPQVGADGRFRAVLRIDPILRDWPQAARKLAEWGYQVEPAAGTGPTAGIGPGTVQEARRFLRDWLDRMKAIYVAASLPPDWRYPDEADPGGRAGQAMLERVVLPVCAERGLPLAMMIGSQRQANPQLRDAGDMAAKGSVESVARLCQAFPQGKFLVTMLAREDQHELCVAARKFGNLMVFGCWWFLNTPSLIEEITRMRVELLGTSFIPQHSDARVLEQIIYKWEHSKRVIGRVLVEKYQDLARSGWAVRQADIERDVRQLLDGNFARFIGP